MSDKTMAAGAMKRLEIDTLGAQGDGIAQTGMGPVYVPLTLPGEIVEALVDEEAMRGQLKKILTPSADRIAPVCRHFGQCGGCALQHMAGPAYLEWKRGGVTAAFAARGLEVSVEPVRAIEARSRRRGVLAARRTKKTVQLGFHGPRDKGVIDLIECTVLHPDIVGLLPQLKELVGPLLTRKGEARLTVTRAANGFDVGIEGVREKITASDRAQLALQAQDIGLVRLTLDDEVISEQTAPLMRFGGVDVALPTGTFLQASLQADELMAQIVVAALDGARHVADLFSGVGTLSLPMARIAQVSAIDNDREAVIALDMAVRHAQGLKPVDTRMRDLFLEPLSGKELEAFDGIVFDPPRAGAKAQAQALAASQVPLVVAVSCNPRTLARDVRTLIDGGYRLEKITPIDQFVYSPHVEAIAVLRR